MHVFDYTSIMCNFHLIFLQYKAALLKEKTFGFVTKSEWRGITFQPITGPDLLCEQPVAAGYPHSESEWLAKGLQIQNDQITFLQHISPNILPSFI